MGAAFRVSEAAADARASTASNVYGEVAALRDALRDGLSISSAVSRARESLRGDTHILVGALAAFEPERADSAMEAALAMRSVERTVEEVLLPSLAELARRQGDDSAAWALGVRWSVEWIRRAQRLTPPPARPGTVLIGDATRDDLDVDAPSVRALELFIGRTGVRVATLPIRNRSGLAELVAALDPGAVIIAGRQQRRRRGRALGVRRALGRRRAAAGAVPPRQRRAAQTARVAAGARRCRR